MNRRTFLAATAAAAAASAASEQSALALQGGKPVREKPLRAGFIGTDYYDAAEQRELTDVLEKRQPFRWAGPGPQPPGKVAAFEEELVARMKTRFALAVTSGSAALSTALAALEVGPGDEVILPAWTWYSCFNAIVLAGALPVFAEIDESFGIDPADLEAKITPQTKAIMAVHIQGGPCDMERILDVAARHRVRVLEDCAQSLGASFKGRPVGSLGDIGIFSMQIYKTITSGEGGAVVTSDPVLFERAARFHDLGLLRAPLERRVGRSQVEMFPGSQFRMSEFTGGVLLAQIRKLDPIRQSLAAHAQRIRAGISDLPGIRFRQAPDPAGDLGSFVFLGFDDKARRDRFMKAMTAENVPALALSGSALLPVQPYVEQKKTIHPAWPSFTSERGKAIRYGATCCPKTATILDRFAGVALHPKFTPSDVDDIIAAIRKVHPTVG